MKIIMINGSHRKNGATAAVLNDFYQTLKTKPNVDVQIIHVADLNLHYCIGCCECYRRGQCVLKDDVDALSANIEKADGIILASPTYASNVSRQMKVIIDRGHFIMEQLLLGKYAMSIATYENYGGRDTSKILNKLLSYSGALMSSAILIKTPYSINPVDNVKIKKKLLQKANQLYHDIDNKTAYRLQSIKHFLIFKIGIFPFVMKKKESYKGVIEHWQKRNINKNGL